MILQFDRLQSVINGAVSCSNEEDGVLLHRFTSEQEELYKSYNEDFYKKTFASAGIQINLVTDAEKLDLKIATASGSSRKFFSCDLFVNGSFFDALDNFSDKDIPKYYAGMHGTLGEYRKTFDLGKGKKRLDLYLPWSVAVKIQTFDLQNATFYSPVKYGKKLLAFGDSITHGYDALRPSNHYATLLAKALDAELINKGIGGEVFFPPLAKTKESFVPDYITVAYGTNDWSCRDEKTYRENCRAFYKALCESYPKSKIFAITPIWRVDYQRERPFGDFLKVPSVIREEVNDLPVTVIDGYSFVPEREEAFADAYVHPNDESFRRYFEGLYAEIKKY